MRRMMQLGRIDPSEMGPELVDKLLSVYPEGQRGNGFWFTLPSTSPLVEQLLAVLHHHGLRLWDYKRQRDRAKEYTLDFFRDYDESDFDYCEYMTFHMPWTVDTIERDNAGRLGISCPTSSISRDALFAWTLEDTIVVRDRAKRILESADLLNVEFQETFCDDRRDRLGLHVSWDKYDEDEPWWEMTSDLILPPVSPIMIVRDRLGNRVEPGYEKMCSVRDPVCPECRDVELHYRKQDIRTVEPFDLALSFERRPGRFHVVSKRFYDVCKQHNMHDISTQHNLRTDWVPVRIDD